MRQVRPGISHLGVRVKHVIVGMRLPDPLPKRYSSCHHTLFWKNREAPLFLKKSRDIEMEDRTNPPAFLLF